MGMVLSAVGACLLFILKVVGILLLILLVLAALFNMPLHLLRGCLLENDTLTVKAGALGIPLFRCSIPQAGTSAQPEEPKELYRQAENKIPRMACGAQATKRLKKRLRSPQNPKLNRPAKRQRSRWM